MSNTVYYRPEWTCGRINPTNNAAILYNLIAGYSYYFEDDSAIVIGELLKVQKNAIVPISAICQKIDLVEDCLVAFLQELETEGLVSSCPITAQVVDNYRKLAYDIRSQQTNPIERTIQEKLPIDVSDAERLYIDKGGLVTSVMLELTYRCSEMCIHCYNIGATRNNEEVSRRGDIQELTLDEYKRVIDEMYELGLCKVCLSGGDPFSNSNAWAIIEYLYSKDIAFDIFTNGQQVDCERLAKYHPRVVGMSVYSGVAKDHDYITRKPGSWQKTIRAMQQLSKLAIPLQLKCCVLQSNFKSYYTVYELCKQLFAIPQIEISIQDSVEGDQCARKLRLSPDQLEVVMRDQNVPLYVGPEAPSYGGGQHLDTTETPCGAGDNTFCLTPNGDLIPCCSFHLVYGNIKEADVRYIVENSEIRKRWLSTPLSEYTDCCKHDYCEFCNLCAGNNYSLNNDLLEAGENNCYVAKVRYNLAVRMQREAYDPLKGKLIEERIKEFSDYKEDILKRIVIK